MMIPSLFELEVHREHHQSEELICLSTVFYGRQSQDNNAPSAYASRNPRLTAKLAARLLTRLVGTHGQTLAGPLTESLICESLS